MDLQRNHEEHVRLKAARLEAERAEEEIFKKQVMTMSWRVKISHYFKVVIDVIVGECNGEPVCLFR